MLFLDPAPRLRDHIVSVLCDHSPLTVAALHLKCRSDGKLYSLQAIYKELLILEENGIVMKAKGNYRLTLTWVFACVAHTEHLLGQVAKGGFGADLIPAAGKSRSWRFSDARSTDRLWVQLVTFLLQKSTTPHLYQSLPHPWHALLYDGLDEQFMNVLKKSGARTYCVVGGDTYLDRAFISRSQKQNALYANAPGLFREDGPVYLAVVGDYVIHTYYPAKFTKAVDAYFQQVKSKRDIRIGEVNCLFQNPGPIITKIAHSPTKALRIRRKFQRYFGLRRSEGIC